MESKESQAKRLGQFFTKKTVAGRMVEMMASLPTDAAILEPCFGGGAFLRALENAGYTNVEGIELDPALCRDAIPRFPAFNLSQGDFLQFQPDKLYDGIIMNPPYIRQENIDALADFGISKNLLRSAAEYKILPPKANLYMYFVVHAVKLLRPGGLLVIIFPNSWLNSQNGRILSEFISSNCKMEDKVSVSEAAFEDDVLVEVEILKLQKSTDAVSLAPPEAGPAADMCVFESCTRNLLRYAETVRGITTRCNQMFVNPKCEPDDRYLTPIISSPKAVKGYTTQDARCDKLLTLPVDYCRDFPDCADSLFSLDAQGENNPNIQEYVDGWKNRILQDKKPLSLYNEINNGSNWLFIRKLDCKGIIFSYFVRNSVRFIDNSAGLLVRDNFYIIRPKINTGLLLALLNNFYTFYQLELYGRNYGNGLLKIQKYDIDKLVFPDIGAFTTEDTQRLMSLSELLCSTNSKEITVAITILLEHYYRFPATAIIEKCNSLKNSRLKHHHAP